MTERNVLILIAQASMVGGGGLVGNQQVLAILGEGGGGSAGEGGGNDLGQRIRTVLTMAGRAVTLGEHADELRKAVGPRNPIFDNCQRHTGRYAYPLATSEQVKHCEAVETDFHDQASTMWQYLTDNFPNDDSLVEEMNALFETKREDMVALVAAPRLEQMVEAMIPVTIARELVMSRKAPWAMSKEEGFRNFADKFRDMVMGPEWAAANPRPA